MKACLCICTYRRNQSLLRLLECLNVMNKHGSDLDVIVVDNHPEALARVTVESFNAQDFRLHYCHESKRGLANARNRALDEANSFKSEFIGFIDDDETIKSDWLIEMTNGLRKFDGDIGFGPVIFCYDEQPPRWITESGVVDYPFFENGSTHKTAWSGNSFFKTSLLQHGDRFSSDFNRSGGEDTIFFRSLSEKGAKIVFIAGAPVLEYVPRARTTMTWIIQRLIQYGHTEAYLSLVARHATLARAKVLISGLTRIAVALVLTLPVIFLHKRKQAWVFRLFFRGLGMILRASGVQLMRY